MFKQLTAASLAFAVLAAAATSAFATDYTVEMRNKGADGVMVFEPVLTQIAVGDTITFVATDKGHNAESIDGLIPDGAKPFKGQTNKDLTVTFEVPGVYAVKCLPHFTMGMVALVEVGNDTSNLPAIEAAKLPKMAAKRLVSAFKTLDAE